MSAALPATCAATRRSGRARRRYRARPRSGGGSPRRLSGRARRRRRDDGASVRARLVRRGPVRRRRRAPEGTGRHARAAASAPTPRRKLVLTTPNVANWSMRLSLLAGRWRYTDRGILDRTHTHLFTRKTLVETVVSAGTRSSSSTTRHRSPWWETTHRGAGSRNRVDPAIAVRLPVPARGNPT